jgi:ligand-binding sensor domain-containing protein
MDKNNNLWLFTFNGVLIFRHADLKRENLVNFFKTMTINSGFQDSDGNYWLGTMGEGVIFCPSIDDLVLNERHNLSDKYIQCINLSPEGVIYAGTYNSHLHIIEGDDENRHITKTLKFSTTVRKIVFRSGNPIILTDRDLIEIERSGKRKNYINKKAGALKSLYITKKDEIYIGGSNRLWRAENDILKEIFKLPSTNRIYGLEQADTNSIYLGGEKGLTRFYFNDKRYSFVSAISSKVNDLAFNGNNELFVATMGSGLYVLKNDKPVFHYSGKKGAELNVTSLYYDSLSGYIYAGSTEGVLGIYNREGSFHVKIHEQGVAAASGINDLFILGRRAYLATDNGIMILKLSDEPKKHVAPEVFITKILVNDRDTAIPVDAEFIYSQNNIKI